MAFVVIFFGTIGISLSPSTTAGVHSNLESTVFLGENALFVAERQGRVSQRVQPSLLLRLYVQCSADGGVR